MGFHKSYTAQEALLRLKEGNERFAKGLRSVEPLTSSFNLKELAEKGQKPFGIILACSDSRVPAEILFDCGLGDLFVVRVAGNVVSSSTLASIEYAASQFESPICLVMGHSKCGAVNAATDFHLTENPLPSPAIQKLVKKITSSVKSAAQMCKHLDRDGLANLATVVNVQQNLQLLTKNSELLKERVSSGKLTLVGAVYDLFTGKVDFDLREQEDKIRLSHAANAERKKISRKSTAVA